MAEFRSRSWATVVYPESATDGWRDVLAGQCVKALVSPLHDADINADGTPKKPHYHVLWVYDGKKSQQQAQAAANAINGGVLCQRVESAKGYARYLCHLDNPDKAQYDTALVTEYGGASFAAIALSDAELVESTLTEVETYIEDFHVRSYAGLLRYARIARPDWLRVIRTHTIHLSALLRSLQWEDEQEERAWMDADDIKRREGV